MESIKIEAVKREGKGKKSATDLRREDMIPCVLYGGKENISFAAPYNDFRPLIYSPDFHVAEITVDGQTYRAILKDLQFHPVTDKVIHIDFQELVADRKVVTQIPVKVTGFPIGVRDGGNLSLKVKRMTVKALPKDLPHEIIVDVTHLKMGQSVKVRDLNIDGVEIMTSAGIPVAQVVVPRKLKGTGAAEGEEAEGEEGAEGEGEGGGEEATAEASAE